MTIKADSLIVRPIQTGDAATIIEMALELAASVGDPVPRLTVADLVREGIGSGRWFECFVAETDGLGVGYLLACRAYEAHTANKRLWLGDLYVRPQARRSGVGRALMAADARRAVELGCDAVYWELWRSNEGGKEFYKLLGAKEINNLAIMRLDGPLLAAVAAPR